MSFWKKLFSSFSGKKNENVNSPPQKTQQNELVQNVQAPPNPPLNEAMMQPVSGEEKDIVALITSIIMAGNNPKSNFRVKNVYRMGQGYSSPDENEMAAVISLCSAVVAQDSPDKSYTIKTVKQTHI